VIFAGSDRRNSSRPDAGSLPWFKSLPDGWQLTQLKHALVRNDGGVWGDDAIEAGSIVLRSTDMTPNGSWDIREPAIRTLTAHEVEASRLLAGDLLMTKSSGSALHLGKTAQVTEQIEAMGACFSNFMQRLRPAPEFHSRYLFWFLNSSIGREEFNYYGTTTTGLANLSGSLIGSLRLPMPSLREQQAIAAFLDRETARIDELVMKRWALVEALESRLRSAIYAWITGDKAQGSRKDVAIRWLPSVPEHWEVAPLYSRYTVQLGKMLDGSRISGHHLAPYLRNINVQWDRFDLDDLLEMDFDAADRMKYRLRRGDLLVCEGGEVGRAAMWQDEKAECFYQKALHRVRVARQGEEPRFLLYVLWAAASMGVFVAEGNPNTFDHLTAEKLRRHRFPFPPAQEQRDIVSTLDAMLGTIRASIPTLHAQISLIQERRQALITAAVTGQMDGVQVTA
jgi:type I restriction enzyme, S subunit